MSNQPNSSPRDRQRVLLQVFLNSITATDQSTGLTVMASGEGETKLLKALNFNEPNERDEDGLRDTFQTLLPMTPAFQEILEERYGTKIKSEEERNQEFAERIKRIDAQRAKAIRHRREVFLEVRKDDADPGSESPVESVGGRDGEVQPLDEPSSDTQAGSVGGESPTAN